MKKKELKNQIKKLDTENLYYSRIIGLLEAKIKNLKEKVGKLEDELHLGNVMEESLRVKIQELENQQPKEQSSTEIWKERIEKEEKGCFRPEEVEGVEEDKPTSEVTDKYFKSLDATTKPQYMLMGNLEEIKNLINRIKC